MKDPFNLQRFIDAQKGAYTDALDELRRGRKVTHWMWFVFPQIAGLGSSPTAVAYALRDLAEACAYSEHPVLGPRLRECVAAVLAHRDTTAEQIFGYPDVLKLGSSMTLFELAGADGDFGEVLECFYAGERDTATLRIVADMATP